MSPWKLPVIVAAIAVPIVFAFYLSPGLGFAAGALVAVAVVVIAARQVPRGAIGSPPAAVAPRRVLIVVARPLEGPGPLREVAELAERGAAAPASRPEVRVLSPVQIGFLDRWASELEPARREAQRRLVLAVATLAKAGIEAEARVGDENLVQAVEDQLGGFAATDVVLVAAPPGEDSATDAAAAELQRRLRAEFRRVTASGPGAR